MSYKYNQHHLGSKSYDGHVGDIKHGGNFGYQGQKVKFIKDNNAVNDYNYKVIDLSSGEHLYNVREQCIPVLHNKIYKPEQSKVFDKNQKL